MKLLLALLTILILLSLGVVLAWLYRRALEASD